jgi:hypothetical protein
VGRPGWLALVADVTANTLRDVIVRNADRASWVMPGESPVYPGIGKEFAGRGTVNHSANEYALFGRLQHDQQRREFLRTTQACGVRPIPQFFRSAFASVSGRSEYIKYNHRSTQGYGDEASAAALLRGTQGKRLKYQRPSQASHG